MANGTEPTMTDEELDEFLKLRSGEFKNAGSNVPTSPLFSVSAEDFTRGGQDVVDWGTSTDRDFSPVGIPNWNFRAGLARQDTHEEKAQYLDKVVGKEQWGQDKFGHYALTSDAAARFGVESDIPVLIEDRATGERSQGTGFTRYDLADIQGYLPEIAGGVVGGAEGMAVGGFPGAIAGAVAGAWGGRGLQETGEYLGGENLQSLAEVVTDMNISGGMAGAGELVGQPLMALGRVAAGPRAGKMREIHHDAVRTVEDAGGQMRISGATEPGGLLPAFESMTQKLFGDKTQLLNDRIFKAALNKLRGKAGPSLQGRNPEKAVRDGISEARTTLGNWGDNAYNQIGFLAQGRPIIPSADLKKVADEIMQGWTPSNVTPGTYVAVDPLEQALIKDIQAMGDFMTVEQVKSFRKRFRGYRQEGTATPNVLAKYSRNLTNALRDGTNKVPGPTGDLLRQVNAKYAIDINKFKDALVQRILKDHTFASHIPEEQLMSAIFRKKNGGAIRRIMPFMSKERRETIRRSAMEEILDKATKPAANSLEDVWDPVGLINALEGYGQDTLSAMFTKGMYSDMVEFSKGLHAAMLKPQGFSGGLVVATIALNPLGNITRLARLRMLGDVLASRKGFKWATKGYLEEARKSGVAQFGSNLLRGAIHSGRATSENKLRE